MTLKTIIAGSLLTASSAALAWTPYYGNGWGNNGNFIGDGNFGFSMNANARGNGNGWGNGYNGYRPNYGPAYYGPALSQDQIEAQQKAQADYFKKMEEQRKAYFEAQQKAQEEYAAMMEKRYGNKK